jgi:hypothetical protein
MAQTFTALLPKLLTVLAVHALTVHVATTPSRASSAGCVFVIRNAIVEGGRQTTCLLAVDGVPSPGGVVESRGTMTFDLPRGRIRTRVTSVLRFRSDGVHARQTVRGVVVGGTGAFAGMRGTVSGTAAVADRASGLGRVVGTYSFSLAHG